MICIVHLQLAGWKGQPHVGRTPYSQQYNGRHVCTAPDTSKTSTNWLHCVLNPFTSSRIVFLQVVSKERQYLHVTQSVELCTTLAGARALLLV